MRCDQILSKGREINSPFAPYTPHSFAAAHEAWGLCCLIPPASPYSLRGGSRESTVSTWRVSPKETWFPKVLHTCGKWTARPRGGEGRSVCLGGTCSISDHICTSKQCKTRGTRIHREKWSMPRTWLLTGHFHSLLSFRELQPNGSSNQHELVQAGCSPEATPEESRWCPPWVLCDIKVQFSGRHWETFQKHTVTSNEMLMPKSLLEAPPYWARTRVCPAEIAQHNWTLLQLCRGGQCPQPVAHGVAAAPHGLPAPLCGLGELSGSSTVPTSRDNLTIPQLWGLYFRRQSHTRTNTNGNQVLAELSPKSQPGTRLYWQYMAEELLPLSWLEALDTKRYHIYQVTAALSDWRLHHHGGWKTKRFSAKNPQRCSVLASQLLLFFFDLSPVHLLFPTLTIKHFPLTLCRALLKKGLV